MLNGLKRVLDFILKLLHIKVSFIKSVLHKLAELAHIVYEFITHIGKYVLLLLFFYVAMMIGATSQGDSSKTCEIPVYDIRNPNTKSFKVTKADVYEINMNFRKILDRQGRSIQLLVNEHDASINAYANSRNQVVILKGMMDFVKSKDELAAVIGHEYAHQLLGHTQGGIPVTRSGFTKSPYREAMSDILGAQLMKMAGYNPCAGISLWQRMRERGGNDVIASHSHPNYGARIKTFKLICVGDLK